MLSEVIFAAGWSSCQKVLYATYAEGETPAGKREEIGWLSNKSAPEALALARTGVSNDGKISRERALELVHMVLHDNAAKLYGIE